MGNERAGEAQRRAVAYRGRATPAGIGIDQVGRAESIALAEPVGRRELADTCHVGPDALLVHDPVYHTRIAESCVDVSRIDQPWKAAANASSSPGMSGPAGW